MRNTKQREIVFNIVSSSFNHLTAEEIYTNARKHFPNISLGTVYRNLNLLVDLNKIKKIKMFDGKDRYDKLDDKHIHFVCTECGKVFDVYEYYFDENIKSLKDFDITGYDITLSGKCENCKRKEGSNELKRNKN